MRRVRVDAGAVATALKLAAEARVLLNAASKVRGEERQVLSEKFVDKVKVSV